MTDDLGRLLDATLPTPASRRHAALMLNQSRDHNDEAVDEDQVRWARNELEAADEHYAAASTSSLLATIAARRGHRDAARRELDRAETRYTLAGSMYGVPNCEYRRARLCMDEGDDATAREHLRRVQHLVSQLPQGLENVKVLVRRLDKLDQDATLFVLEGARSPSGAQRPARLTPIDIGVWPPSVGTPIVRN